MEVGVDSPDGGKVVAMDFPAGDGGAAELSSPPMMPPRLRRRLTETKSSSPSTVEEIEAKLRDADLRRQKFYEHLSSKARPKPRSPPQSAHDISLGQRLEAKLQAAEQKRSSILAKAQMRLAKLDELRQAARNGVEVRFKKERAELGSKVESRVQQAETNRLHILKAYSQRRATLNERTSQSLLRRMVRESKYKEHVRAAISQKRAAAEKKRMGLLEADKKKAHARVSRVRKIARSVLQQREIERSQLRESLEDRLQRAKRQRGEYLMQRARLHSSVGLSWNRKKQQQADSLSRKLARCWKKFLRSGTTFDLAKAYEALKISKVNVQSMPFEQLAVLIESPSTLQTAKALFDRLEIRHKLLLASTTRSHVQDDIDHLLKRVASPNKRGTPRRSARGSVDGKRPASVREAAKSPVKLSRYQVRVVLCAYMILGHPDAVFSGQGERETALASSAEKFVQEFELLIKIILDGPVENSSEGSDSVLPRRCTFRSQLAAFDAAWCSYLKSFVVWKVKDAESLEEDLVKAACQLEVSMMQKCKLTPEGDSGDLTHDMKAIQKQVTEDQKLLREKVLHLSGDAGLERMQNALSNTRTKYFEARENGSPVGSPPTRMLSSSPPTRMLSSSPPARMLSSSPPTRTLSPSPPSFLPGPSPVVVSDKRSRTSESNEGSSRVVRSLFKGETFSPPPKEVPSSASNSALETPRVSYSSETLDIENEFIVNEFVHGQNLSFAEGVRLISEDQNTRKVREMIEKAFWDGITESIKQDDYGRVVELLKEVRDELCEIAPQRWKQGITEAIDLDILSQLLNSGSLDMDYLGKILEFASATLQRLSSAADENKLKEAHQKVSRELAELCQTGDRSNRSHALALIKGLRFVLEQIQSLKQEISKARIKIMEPLLKGPAGLEYLRKAFTKHYGQPSDALTSLPLTKRWLSSVCASKDQEWSEHTRALSDLSSSQETSLSRLLPSTALRTGGNFSVKMSGAQPSSLSSSPTDAAECKGDDADLMVRLGLLKLVNEVYGLAQEELPETMKLNFFRLRAVQAQLQKITVIATSILVLRQALLLEQMVRSPEELESTITKCATQLSEMLDSVEDAGIQEIIEVLSKTAEGFDKSNDSAKIQSRKIVMTRMLRKSVQAGDAVFARVSRAVYLAARGVVLGGSGAQGRELAEMALRQVGAAVLTDKVVEAGKAVVVVAKVTTSVHGEWYAQLIEKM